jgi:hypothetical protein
MICQIEYVSSGSDTGMPCSKPAVAQCADCGSAIFSECYRGVLRAGVLTLGVE